MYWTASPGGAVQGLVEDSVADVLGVASVEVLEVGPEGEAGGVGQKVMGSGLTEWVAVDLRPEVCEWLVQLELAVLEEGANR